MSLTRTMNLPNEIRIQTIYFFSIFFFSTALLLLGLSKSTLAVSVTLALLRCYKIGIADEGPDGEPHVTSKANDLNHSRSPALIVSKIGLHQLQLVFGFWTEIVQMLHFLRVLEAAHCPTYPEEDICMCMRWIYVWGRVERGGNGC